MERCKVEGCGRLKWAAGYCSKHYNRLRTTGSLEDGPKARRPLSDRLWRNVAKRGPAECWPWIGSTRTSGYGSIGTGGRKGKSATAHRVVWELTHGPIPRSSDYHGMVVMHTCDNRLCCNPLHLVLGRQSDNVRDMDDKGRRVSAPRFGEKHHNAKLTDEQVRYIRNMGGSSQEIAKLFGITPQNVRYIRSGKAWKHV